MKFYLCCLLAIGVLTVSGQTRNIRFKTLPNDSINLHMDENYFLIEDTCSKIIRFAHYKFQERKFFGPFKDINKNAPDIVVSEGNYTDGLLDGPFTMRYLDGDLRAQGTYTNGGMLGKWTLYHPDNQKQMEFENKDGDVYIANAWDASGKQTIVNGTGNYRVDFETIYWEGKLLNGKPDGTWRSKRTADRTGTVLTTEQFKDGVFVKGSGAAGKYTDASRIILLSNTILPISNAALVRISRQNCDPTKTLQIPNAAVYKDGRRAFFDEIKRVIAPVFRLIDLQYHSNKRFSIRGEVDEKGKITNLKYVNTFDDKASSALVSALYRLPYLEPALVDKKPVKSAITFTFNFENNQYTTNFQLHLPQTNLLSVPQIN